MSEPKYPYVRCDAHPGGDEPGYIVCEHVLGGASVAEFQAATIKDIGKVLCHRCVVAVLNCGSLFNLPMVLCCAHSVRESGWDKVRTQ